MGKTTAWQDGENVALIALYFAMLDRAAIGQPYIKAAMIRTRQKDGEPLAGRSKQSIEFKLMNATAAHAAIDPEAVTMDGFGYRAMPNMQAALKSAMALKIETRRRCYIGNDGKRYA